MFTEITVLMDKADAVLFREEVAKLNEVLAADHKQTSESPLAAAILKSWAETQRAAREAAAVKARLVLTPAEAFGEVHP